MPYTKWACLLTYHLNQDSVQISGTIGKCHSSESWVCKCLKRVEEEDKTQKVKWLCDLAWMKVRRNTVISARLTCCQDKLTVLRYFDGGAHCGHLKVLDELNPALDVWGGKWKREVWIPTVILGRQLNLAAVEVNLPTSFFCNCLFFRSDSHCTGDAN